MTADQFRRLQEIFGAAIDRPAGERASFVERASEGDDLLGRELRALLAAHRDGDTFLERSFVDINRPLVDDPGPLAPGQTLGSYRIEREIDRGGMGVVYLARDTRLDRDVAIKALGPRLLGDTRQRERFRREALAAASVSHPAIATIHAFEELDGFCYIVSEYVPGRTLAAEIEDGPLDPETVLDIAFHVAEGLEAAHEKGVVHRDLKPANIGRDRNGRPKVLDFGLALLPESESGDQRLTQAGQLLGSPAYMSPEQLQGGPLDFRTDLFSFGVVLYEMASGRHPFQESTAAGTTAGILRSEPPRLSGSDPLSSGLDRIIRRCLRKTPEERYRTTADLVGDLRSLSTIPPRRDSAPARVPGRELPGYWWAFHQGAVVLLYAAMALSLMGIRNEGAVAVAAYFGIVICASANGIMRIHLLFTSRFNPGAVVGELVRVSPWIRRADWLFSVCIAGAALTLFPRLQLIASLLVAVAIGYLVVFLVIEPATVKAVFPDRNPSDGGA